MTEAVMMPVYRDAEGRVINIGDWDYQGFEVVTNPVPDQIHVEDEPDEEGRYRQVWRDPATREVLQIGAWDLGIEIASANIPPPGFSVAEELVVEDKDHGRYVLGESSTPKRNWGL